MTDLDLINVHVASSLVFDVAGRIVCVNDPPRSPGPRMVMGGCALGNISRFHRDVDEAGIARIAKLLASEPPLSRFDSRLVHAEAYAEILSDGAHKAGVSPGLVWHLPNTVGVSGDWTIVRSGTSEGEVLLERFGRRGVPMGLFDMGFTDVGEFWAPWCAVYCGEEIASLGFTARLGRDGADLGLVTVPAFRGRGFGARATAAWAAHPALAGKTLFYSTSVSNLSSQRVVERLGLRFIGASCVIR